MDLSELEVRLSARLTDLQRDLRQANRMVERAGKEMGDKVDLSAKAIGASLTKYVTLPLAAAGAGMLALGNKAFQAAARMDTLQRSMSAIMGSAVGARREIDELQKIAMAPGISFEAAIEGSQRLQSVGLSAAKTRDLLIQMANANALVGGSTENLQGALLQLSQTLGSGFLQGDELRIIAERIPVFRRALMSEFKTANSQVIGEMMKSGELSMDAFIDGLIRGLVKMPRAQAGIQAQLDKIKDMMFRAMAEAGKELIPVVQDILPDLIAAMKELIPLGRDLASIFRGMVPSIKTAIGVLSDLAKWFSSLPPSMQQTIVKAGVVAAVLGPLVSTFAALRSAVLSTVAAYDLLIGQRAAVQAALLTMSTGATTTATSFAAIGGAIRTLVAGSSVLRLLFNPITAIVAAVYGIAKAYQYVSAEGERYDDELHRQIKALDDADKAASKTASASLALVNEYRDLHAVTRPTAEQSDKLRDVLNKISLLNPELISGYDKQGNALGLLAGAYSKAADQAERLAKAAAIANARPLAEQRQKITEQILHLKEIMSGSINPMDPGFGDVDFLKSLGMNASVGRGTQMGVTYPTFNLPNKAELESKIAELTRTYNSLGDQMKAALNPETAATTGGVSGTTGFGKSVDDATKKMTEAQREAQSLAGQLYDLTKANALGADATESMSLAYDLLMGKIAPVNEALAGQVLWQQMLVEHQKKVAESTQRWAQLQSDLEVQTKMLTATTNEERAVIETQIGQYRDLTDEQKQYIVLKAKERDEIEKSDAAQKSEADALRSRKEAIESLVSSLEKEVALLDKKTRMAEFLYRLNQGEFAGASDQDISRARELLAILDQRDEDEARRQRAKKWFEQWLHDVEELANKAGESTKRFDDAMLGLRERMADTLPEADRLRFTMERLTESFGGGKLGAERAKQYMDELLDVKKAEAWRDQLQSIAKSVGEAFLDMFDSLLRDGFQSFFTNVLQGFRKMLSDIATEYIHSQLLKWLTSALSSVFGGAEFRAAGGPVTQGRPYIVGENGPEMFVPGSGGQIVPGVKGAASQTNVFNFHFPNVTDVDGVRRSRTQVALEYARAIGQVQHRTA